MPLWASNALVEAGDRLVDEPASDTCRSGRLPAHADAEHMLAAKASIHRSGSIAALRWLAIIWWHDRGHSRLDHAVMSTS